MTDDFDEDRSDNWSRYLKLAVSTSGAILGPIGSLLGPIFGEIIGNSIPGQRVDRIATYLRTLRSRLSDELLEQLASVPDRISLIEEGLYAATFTPQISRVERLGLVVATGLSKEQFDLDHESHVLGIVRGMSDADVIVLQYLDFDQGPFDPRTIEFARRHAAVLPLNRSLTTQNADEFYRRKSIYRSHLNKLYSDGLLDRGRVQLPKPPYRLDTNHAGEQVANYVAKVADSIIDVEYQVTHLGKDVLSAIADTALASESHAM